MSANLKYSAVATGLEKVSFHSKPKEGQCQRMFKLPDNCAHFTCHQGNTQNSLSYSSTVHEPRTPRCTSWIQKRQKNQRPNCQLQWIIEKTRECQENTCFCFTDYTKAFDCVLLLPPSHFSRVQLCATPQTAAHQAPPTLGTALSWILHKQHEE